MPVEVPDPIISLRESEQIVDSLNEAVELEGGLDVRVKFLLNRLRELLKREGRAALTMLEDLTREPAPQIAQRFIARPEWDHYVVDDDSLQALWDDSRNLSSIIVQHLLSNLRHPFTVVSGIDAKDPVWYRDVLLAQHLGPQGYVDVLISAWAPSDARAVCIAVLQRAGEPAFDNRDRMLTSLMLRASAPMVDRELLKVAAAREGPKLSARQRVILGMLLSGDSEKEVAHQLNRSIHTVHTHVRQLYDLLNVSSRGQLMALFVDRTIMSSLVTA